MAKMSFFIRNWAEFVDIDKLKAAIAGRKVYIVNENEEAKTVKDFLEDKGISVEGYIVSKLENGTEKINDEPFKSHQYIIDTSHGPSTELCKAFQQYGYKKNIDMTIINNYFSTNEVEGYFADDCGNEIIVAKEMTGLEIRVFGYNNKVKIGNGFWSENFRLYLKGGASVEFGDNTYSRNGQMYLHNSNTVFEGNSWLGSNFFISNFDGELHVGKEFSALDSLYMCCVENTKLTFGNDCMCAKSVKILSGGAHSLYDLTLKENINMKEGVHVNIGEHVWLGMESSVIYNSDIGAHSMVGAKSLVKGTYPDHCVIAGNIAKVIRTNTDWNEEDYLSFPEYQEIEEMKRKQKNS